MLLELSVGKGEKRTKTALPDRIVDILESEKPMDLEEEVKRYYSDNFAYLSSDQPTLSILTNIARHFTDWQKERLFMEGLDAVRSDSPNKIEKTIAGVFVKYGMDSMKEQMMKEAIHYVVQDDLDSHGASYNIPFIRLGTVALKPKGIGVGDKVCIIIVKEDEK